MLLKLFIVKLDEGMFAGVSWQKGAPFLRHNISGQGKDLLRRDR
jgi:hypothetical protein